MQSGTRPAIRRPYRSEDSSVTEARLASKSRLISILATDHSESVMAKSAAPEKPPRGTKADDPPWLDAEKSYALGIEAGKLVCRNPAGKKLASVPKELKESELAEQLRALCEWLADHRTECLRRVEMWMLRSLAVPCEGVRAVWPDPDWSEVLRNLVVTPADGHGEADAPQASPLRDLDP